MASVVGREAATQQIEPTTEALHLRRLIEQQPACLMRVGIDGLLLAVNEAALRLLGGEALPQVLGSQLTNLIMPRQHEEWREFAARARGGASGSIECDLTDLSGVRRTMLLQGMPLLDHPDGVPSIILTARDISAPRRLEAALRERESSRELDDLQKELQHGFDGREVDLQPLIAPASGDAAGLMKLRQTLMEEHQAALLLKELEAKQLLDSVRTELEQALAEQQRLTTLLSDREIAHERAVAAHAAERAQLQQTITDGHQAALLVKERESQQVLEELRTELAQALAERTRLTALLEEREISLQRVVADRAAERAQLQQTLAEEHQAVLFVKEREAQELLAKEREAQQLRANLQTELDQVVAERQRLTTILDESEINHQRVVAAHAAERARLQQTLAEEHQLTVLLKEREGRQQLDNVRIELEQAIADRQRLAALVDEREISHQRIVAAHASKWAEGKQALAMAAAKQAEIEKALADQRVELQTVEENARNLESFAASGRVALAVGRELQTVVAAVEARTQHLLVECALDADNRHVIEGLRADAIEAASLARQILQIHSEPPVIADSSTAGTAHKRESGDAGREL